MRKSIHLGTNHSQLPDDKEAQNDSKFELLQKLTKAIHSIEKESSRSPKIKGIQKQPMKEI